MEMWSKIEGYPNYEISNTGRVRSLDRVIKDSIGRVRIWKGRELKQFQLDESCGRYWAVNLLNNGNSKLFKVHQLVIKTFKVEPGANTTQVRHLDGDINNNCIENLEYGTAKDNYEDMIRHGRVNFHKKEYQRRAIGENVGISKLKNSDVVKIKILLRDTKYSQRKIGEMFGVDNRTVSAIKTGKYWNHIKIEEN